MIVAIYLCFAGSQALPLPAAAQGARKTEKAVVISTVKGSEIKSIVLGHSFARAKYVTPEAGADSSVDVMARAPEWIVKFCDFGAKKEFDFPLSKFASVKTDYLRLQPKKSNARRAGTWQGMNIWKTRFEGAAGDDSDSILSLMVSPTKSSKVQEKKPVYEYVYTDSIALTKEQELVLKMIYAETIEIAIIGVPVGLQIIQPNGLAQWIWKTDKIEIKDVAAESVQYPVGFQKCDSIDAINFNKEKMGEIEGIGESMEIGKPLGNKKDQRKH